MALAAILSIRFPFKSCVLFKNLNFNLTALSAHRVVVIKWYECLDSE